MKKSERWLRKEIGGQSYQLLNLDDKKIEQEILTEMEAGVAVYYDRRWEVTNALCQWLAKNKEFYRNKSVLVLGAGIGEESILLGREGSHLYLNDLSPVALRLSVEQLRENEITNFTTLLGKYQNITLPEVDLIVGSFLVYNKDTLDACRQFLVTRSSPCLLVNERLPPFNKLLKECSYKILFEEEEAVGVVFG